MNHEKLIESRQIYRGRIVSLRVDQVELPSGRRTTREIVEHPSSVAIVAIDPEENVLLVSQFRRAVGRELLEIPAGKLEPGEEPIQCANRELREETGYLAQEMKKLGGFYASPGFCSEFFHLYLATKLKPTGQSFNPDEIDRLVRVPLSKISALITSGEICDAKSVAGLLLAINILLNSGKTKI